MALRGIRIRAGISCVSYVRSLNLVIPNRAEGPVRNLLLPGELWIPHENKVGGSFPETVRLIRCGVYPPPPRYIGIMELARKCDLIYGLQQVTGKILMSKNLTGEIVMTKAQNGTTRTLRAVTASTMIAKA